MIYELLKKGKENASSKEELLAMTPLKDDRALRAQVHKERTLENRPILSSKGKHSGYFLPSCRAEGAEFLKMLEKEARSIFHAMKAVKTYCGIPDGQIDITDYFEEPQCLEDPKRN